MTDMYRALLVDDEVLVRDAMRENIRWEESGFELAGVCENGKEAAEFIEENPVDLVITDICMPYMDGMELSRILYEKYPRIQIIILSGFGEFEYAKKAIQYKVSEYLLKPVTSAEMSELLQRMKEKLDAISREEQKRLTMEKNARVYKKNADVIRSRKLASLVMRNREVETSLEELKQMGIQLTASVFCIGIVNLDLYSRYYEQNEREMQDGTLMGFVVFNISQEIVENHTAGLAYQEEENQTVIIFQTDSPREFSGEIERICRKIQQCVREASGLDVSIAVGPYVSQPGQLYRSYEEARRALEGRYLLGKGQIFIQDQEDSRERDVSLYQFLPQLQEAVRKSDRTEIRHLLLEIRECIVESRSGKNQIYSCLQQLVKSLEETVLRFGGDPGSLRGEGTRLMRQVMEEKTFGQAMDLVTDYAERVADFMDDQSRSQGKRLAMQAVDYIKKHYADPEMGLNDVCAYLGLSPSRFSTVFKEATGETFMEILIRTRMERAKELLENTSLKNYEIAEKVGFSDPHYFGTSFKRATGMTPTEYARKKRR